jgi:lipopolysaccharide assembly outer membrane protein LptD (OstA)
VAEGYVRFKREKLLAVMDRLELDLEKRTGVFYNAIIYDSDNKAYMTAQEVQWLGGNQFILNQCSFTTCNPKKPTWEISGSQINYRYENFGSSQHTLLKIKGIPVFYFPFLAWPTTSSRKPGFLAPEFGQDTSNAEKFDLGYRIGIPFFWDFDPEHDLTLKYEWVEKRGFGLHGKYQYAFEAGMFGQLQYQKYFEREARDPENESGILSADNVSESELNPERFKLVYNHNQRLDERSRLIVSNTNYSDGQYEKEYERNKNYSLTAHKFSASVNRQFEKGSTTLSVSKHEKFIEEALLNPQTDEETTVQQLPALNYQYGEVFWKSGQQSASVNVSGNLIRYYREKGWNGIGATSTPRLKYYFPLTDYAKGNLGLGRRFSRYQVRNTTQAGSEDEYGFEINEAQVELNTTISRQFVRSSGIFTRLKHQIVPRLQYDFIEDVRQTSASDIPFGGVVSTRKLATLRIENTLLAKRRYLVKPAALTGRSLNRLRQSRFGPALVQRLNALKDRVYPSEKDLIESIEELLGRKLPSKERDELLTYAERGVVLPGSRITQRPSREGPAWTLASLNFIQHYDLLKQDPDFVSKGPSPKGNETPPGKPLLPLRMEAKVQPGPQLSISYFNRYDHLKRRILEYSANVQVGVSAYNKAMVSFRENEETYEDPYGTEISAGKTFGFGQTVEFSDRLALGYSGTVDLDPQSSEFQRRLSSANVNLDYRPDCWGIRLNLNESRDKTFTSSGNEEEYVERSLLLTIKLGAADLPDQPLHKILGR